jgi:hypothetical protein
VESYRPFDCAQGWHFDYEPSTSDQEIRMPMDAASSPLNVNLQHLSAPMPISPGKDTWLMLKLVTMKGMQPVIGGK